ncbi:MAG TPA: hypothetical protein VH139_03595 [Acidobacteriaceae bacterium]|jgi:hypothetical protein|nr:hypothetical protein [Acidobacteriaceae bacterium]
MLKSLPKSEQRVFFMTEELIFSKYRAGGAKIIPDGALSQKSYESARLKVLVVLKEPNDKNGEWCDEGGDIRRHGWEGGREKTWPNLARWAYLFENPGATYSEADSAVADLEKRKANLRRLVVMNLKKEPGSHSAHLPTIEQYAFKYEDLLRKQFSIYKPALTIAGGTHPILVKLMNKKNALRTSPEFFSYFLDENLGIVMDFYHPQPRGKPATINEELFSLLARDLKHHRLA